MLDNASSASTSRGPGTPNSPNGSACSSFMSTAASSRRNSFSISEKPPDGYSAFSSFTNLKSFTSSRVNLLPMPVVTSAASSALETARSWLPIKHISVPSYVPLSALSSTALPVLPARVRPFFANCLYRRLLVWIVAVVVTLVVVLVTSRTHGKLGFNKNAPEPVEPSAESIWLNYTRLDGYFNGIKAIVPMDQYRPEFPTAHDKELAIQEEAALTASVDPASPTSKAKKTNTKRDEAVPTPSPYRAHPDYNSTSYLAKYYPVHQCYLDAENTIPAPELWAYSGVPQDQPEPLIGSHSLLGIRDDVCFDRFGRYGPYGLGYSQEEGGTNQGLDTEQEGKDIVWSKTGKINYNSMDWGAAQKRCFEANKDRFVSDQGRLGATEYGRLTSEMQMKRSTKRDAASIVSGTVSNGTDIHRQKLDRIAIVVRCYAGFKWTPHVVLNFRALVNEMALQSGGEYDVHILLHARDEKIPIWADAETADQFIADNVPSEFRSLVSLWSEGQMRLLYPGLRDKPVFANPANADIHGVYRSPHFPLQHFAQQHPEYAHFWNWEMDMRFLGSYYEFFDRLGQWADAQPRRRIWDRSAKYYIPALHGSWENFTARVDAETHAAGRPSILGEMFFGGRTATRDEERGISPLPEHGCEGAALSSYNRTEPDGGVPKDSKTRVFFNDRNNNYTNIPAKCGVGEPADLITLNPLFDAEDSGWFFSDDITGYNLDFPRPPRRTAIITASRLSRRLLFAMHEESWRLDHGMFAEMFPPSVALHRGFKATYAPHPVYADRRWPLAAAERAFNAGPDHSSGASRDSPFDPANEHFHRGMTWYYNSDFAGRMWRRWLGYLQPLDDPKMPKAKLENEKAEKGKDEKKDDEEDEDDLASVLAGLAGGKGEEESVAGSGRMCMRSVLVHPIKFESLEEIFA